jgi:hypothetical protein
VGGLSFLVPAASELAVRLIEEGTSELPPDS